MASNTRSYPLVLWIRCTPMGQESDLFFGGTICMSLFVLQTKYNRTTTAPYDFNMLRHVASILATIGLLLCSIIPEFLPIGAIAWLQEQHDNTKVPIWGCYGHVLSAEQLFQPCKKHVAGLPQIQPPYMQLAANTTAVVIPVDTVLLCLLRAIPSAWLVRPIGRMPLCLTTSTTTLRRVVTRVVRSARRMGAFFSLAPQPEGEEVDDETEEPAHPEGINVTEVDNTSTSDDIVHVLNNQQDAPAAPQYPSRKQTPRKNATNPPADPNCALKPTRMCTREGMLVVVYAPLLETASGGLPPGLITQATISTCSTSTRQTGLVARGTTSRQRFAVTADSSLGAIISPHVGQNIKYFFAESILQEPIGVISPGMLLFLFSLPCQFYGPIHDAHRAPDAARKPQTISSSLPPRHISSIF